MMLMNNCKARENHFSQNSSGGLMLLLLCTPILFAVAAYLNVIYYLFILVLVLAFTAFFINKPRALLLFQILYCTIFGFLIDDLHAPQIIQYLADYVNLLLLMNLLLCPRKKLEVLKKLKLPLAVMCSILLLNLFSSVANQSGLIHFLWGLRINLRFLVVFVASAVYFDKSAVKAVRKLLYFIVAMETVFCFSQYVLLGIRGDLVGGTFGDHGTGMILTFFSIVFLFVSCLHMEKKASLSTCVLILLLGVGVCAIGEGKAIVVFDAAVFLCIFLFSKRLSQKFQIVLFSALGILLATYLIGIFYSGFSNFFQLSVMQKYLTQGGYGNAQINRLNGIQIISKYLTPLQQWIGVGLGNAASSQFPDLIGVYYQQYKNLCVDWFAFSYYYMESGIIGLVLYLAFFVSCYLAYRKIDKVHRSVGRLFEFTMVLICLMSAFYASIIKTEYLGYLIYALLALPFALAKDACDTKEEVQEDAVSKYCRSGV